MLVWVFLLLGVALMVTTVTTAALAWTDPVKRGKYIRISVVSAAFTIITIVVGSTLRYRTKGDFANEYVEDFGEDTFLQTLVTSTGK